MPNNDSPAVARRRVRLALRSAREVKGLTQTQVAQAMEWSLSKVMRIEKGEVNVSPSDLKLLLDLLEVRDADEVDRLVEDARLSRQERWTIDPLERKYYTPAMIQLYQFEAEATTVRYYQNFVIPGPLQTHQYATALVAPQTDKLDLQVVKARIELRLRRAEELLARAAGPTYLTLLDESVLLRPIGGPAVIADQLEHIARLVNGGRHLVRVLPLTRTEVFFYGPFVLCDVDESGSAAMYRENGVMDELISSSEEINRHRWVFDQMWKTSLDDDASLRRIEAAAAQYRGHH